MLKKKKPLKSQNVKVTEIPFVADVDVKESDDSRWVDEGGSLTTLESEENE